MTKKSDKGEWHLPCSSAWASAGTRAAWRMAESSSRVVVVVVEAAAETMVTPAARPSPHTHRPSFTHSALSTVTTIITPPLSLTLRLTLRRLWVFSPLVWISHFVLLVLVSFGSISVLLFYFTSSSSSLLLVVRTRALRHFFSTRGRWCVSGGVKDGVKENYTHAHAQTNKNTHTHIHAHTLFTPP